jgi:uncharacterized protein YecT (DUF1311 family)
MAAVKIVLALATALLALAATAEPAWDWGDSKDEWAGDFAESKALCRTVRGREPPASDRAAAAEIKSLEGCDSESLYYGIGRAADPVRARKCAFLEMERKPHGVFSGRTMLMTIYANGVGAKRDLDVAMHLACGIEGAPMESDGRVRHLAELKAQGWTGSDFHFCDDITSGLAMGHCAGHEAGKAEARRSAELARLTARWSPAQRRALEPLLAAHGAYVEAHGGGEVDMTGTARAAMSIGAEEALRDEFLDALQRLATGRAPSFSAARYREADARLNAAYRKRLAEAEPASDTGAVTRAGVRDAERAWLRYRDAFLAFAAVRFPAVSRDSLAAWLTEQRIAKLEGVE